MSHAQNSQLFLGFIADSILGNFLSLLCGSVVCRERDWAELLSRWYGLMITVKSLVLLTTLIDIWLKVN
jgi:hypothetical protein